MMSLEDYTCSRGMTNAMEVNSIASGDTNPKIIVGGQRQAGVVFPLCKTVFLSPIYGGPKVLLSWYD